MRYYNITVDSSIRGFHPQYIACTHNYIDKTIVFDTIASLTTLDALDFVSDDFEADNGTYIEPEVEEITEHMFDDFFFYCQDNIKNRFRISTIGFPLSPLIDIYVVYSEPQEPKEEYVVFNGVCGQEGNAECYVKIEKGKTIQDYEQDAIEDIAHQLYKYHDIMGTDLITGLFTVDWITKEDFDTRKEELIIPF